MAIDLSEIERRLASDRAFKTKFLTDPKGTLAEEGILISDEAGKRLKTAIDQVTGKTQSVAGSNIGANPQEVGIGISIGKSF